VDNHALILVATFIAQVKISGFAAWIIQKMKLSKAPAMAWISTNTPWVTRVVAAIAAGCTAVGVSYTYNAATHQAIISGLGATAIITAAW
jgi:hypothetical protein